MDKVEHISNILGLLITPAKVKQSDLERSLRENVRATLDAINCPELSWLKSSINDFTLDERPADDIFWNFTSFCLKLLIHLCDTLVVLHNYSHKTEGERPALTGPADVLGARQQVIIRTTLQLVTCFGIARNLMPGVGVPLHKRSQYSHFLEETSCSPSKIANSEFDKHCMLYVTVCSLHSCCRNANIASLILTKHLNDLLAALCQLCFAPLKKTGRGTMLQSRTSEESSINDEQRTLNDHVFKAETDRKRCFIILTDVLGRTFRPITVKELLALQGAPKNADCLIPAPNWLRRATQKLLDEIMLSEHGLLAVIQGILDNSRGTAESQTSAWQACNVVAKLIANRMSSPQLDCRTNISSQLLKLLEMDQTTMKLHLEVIVTTAISLLIPNQWEIAEKYLLEPLFRPLIMCARGEAYSGNKEGELTKCILNIHKVFVVGKSPNEDILDHLTPTFRLLFHIYAFLSQTISGLRMPVEELLCTYLRHVDVSAAVDRLIEAIFPSADEKLSSNLSWNSNLELALDDEAGLSINKIENPTRLELNWIETDSQNVSSLLAVLSRLQNDGITGQLFLRLLQNLSSLVGRESSCTSQSDGDGGESNLMDIEGATELREKGIRQSLLTLHLLSSLCDNPTLQESILKDTKQTFQFLNATLERGAVLSSSKPEDLESMEAETLTMAMGVLTLILETENADNRRLASVSIPHLNTLKLKHASESVRNMAEQILLRIAINKTTLAMKISNPGRDKMSQFQEAWEDIFDSEIPIRGHAILALTRLISSNDKETIDHCDQLLVAFQENMMHQDSYVYLMAVQGLASLAGKFPDKVVPILTDEFSNAATEKFDAETRMKFGEVLVKVTRMLGEMVPKYRDQLLNTFLVTCRDSDPFVRSSGLSNLGEACKELRFGLGSNVHEIFSCLSSYAKSDSSIHVRRAAIQVIVLLLRGLGKDALDALKDILKDLYGLVKHVYSTDRDDVVKLHAQLALEEMQVICRDFLFPKVTLEKRITVLESNQF